MKRATKEQQDQMVAAYLAGKTTKEAANLLGFTATACNIALDKAGIKARKPGFKRVFSVNENAFADIYSEEQAYALGFISADGCISENKLIVVIKHTDDIVLDQIRGVVGSTHPIRYLDRKLNGKTFKYAQWFVRSTKLVSDLAKLGIRPNKSNTIEPWSGPAELMPAYWRGVVDGDGYLAIRPAKEWHKRVLSLCGSKPMVEAFRDFCTSIVPNNVKIRLNGKSTTNYSIIHSGWRIPEAIVRVLYKNATIALPRKLLLAEKMVGSNNL